MKKETLSITKIIILSIVLSLGISYAIAWTAPTQSPPNGNVFAPINTGPSKQIKQGDLCTSILGVEKCLSEAQVSVPSGTISASPSTIQEGGTTNITWGPISSATSCTLLNPDGTTNKVLSPTEISDGGTSDPITLISGQSNSPIAFQILTYTLNCSGPGGPSSFTAPVTVFAPYSISYTNGTGGWVNIRSGVTEVTFSATGGNGGCGWAACGGGGSGAYNGGGGGAFAQTASALVLYVGGGGGGGVGPGGTGGTTASGNGAGVGGQIYWPFNSPGLPGGMSNGGNGGPSITSSTLGGAGGSNNNPGLVGGTYIKNFYDDFGNIVSSTSYPGGVGGSAGDARGGNSSYYGAGGGGGYGGGGGGAAGLDNLYNGSGGGGGSYFASGMTPSIGTNAPSGRKWALSSIGNPSSIYLRSGPAGVGFSTTGGAPGTITMSW